MLPTCWLLPPILQVEVTKRHAFLTMVVGVVYQHLACFRQGATLLGRIEGPYSDAMAIVEHLQREGQGRQVRSRAQTEAEGGAEDGEQRFLLPRLCNYLAGAHCGSAPQHTPV